MLNRILIAVFAFGLCLPAEGSTNTGLIERFTQAIGNKLLGSDFDPFADSICVRARPKKPGGIKSNPQQRVLLTEETDEQKTVLPLVAAVHRTQGSTPKVHHNDSDEDAGSSVGYDRSQGLSPSLTPQHGPQAASPAPEADDYVGCFDDRGTNNRSSSVESSVPPLHLPSNTPLPRQGTEPFVIVDHE